ncbi:GSCFA domain-containing protein [Proteiniphilum sp. X52]|uniref:GSCFA domain-containing protein n=1 Tax=Proteiniphilum sp. X52 TaxID=2382159 RepID=UPI000F0A88EB|nr:GSCFA domain-containing protein [Proteiniphilum sp. X52]RNC66903.1 GSCFA domain protein [Proteiniphilum sp. X52]
MNFRTIIDIPVSDIRIDHSTRMMLFGSCFSENIGRKLQQYKFRVDANPFGILYNPFSVSAAMQRLLSAIPFSETDLVFNNGIYHSLMHHGQFSAPDKTACLRKISERFESAAANIQQTDLFLITFGSAYTYRWRDSGEIAGNCHKFPARLFHRTRLSVEEVTEEWKRLISVLTSIRPGVKWLFTVSPVRHWKEGAHENQISKSVLHLAIDNLQQVFPENVRYFPAYEVMIDELRDYRFYDEDMMHPSSFAADYIWQLFSNTFFSAETMNINEEWEHIRKAIEHRPLYPGTEAHTAFVKDTLLKMEAFSRRYPEISCDEEKCQLMG